MEYFSCGEKYRVQFNYGKIKTYYSLADIIDDLSIDELKHNVDNIYHTVNGHVISIIYPPTLVEAIENL